MSDQLAPPDALDPPRLGAPNLAARPLLRPGSLPALIPVAGFLLFAAIALYLIRASPYPGPLDELEHVSYAAHLQETHEWRPTFETMQTLLRHDLVAWDNRPNYLGHPAPFYWFVSVVLDRTLPLPAAIFRVRLASAALIAAGIGVALLAGWRVFARDPAALAVFSALVALCPKLFPVAAQVTNDSLAIGAGALAYWAVTRHDARSGAAGAGIALMLACWSKPNAGLAVGAVLLLTALLDRRRRRALAAGLVVGALAGAVPYVPIIVKYGHLVPVTAEQFGAVHQVPGPGYIPAFLTNLAYSFCQQQTGTWPLLDVASAVAAGLVWLFLLATVAAGWNARNGAPDDPARTAAMAGPLAFLLVLPIHLFFAASALGGSIPAASFRYDLPLWPFLAHALARWVSHAPPRLRHGLAYLAFMTLVTGWLSP